MLAAEADDRELVVHRLVAGGLQLVAHVVVDEGGLAAGEGAENGDHGPPRDPGGDGFVAGQAAQLVGNLVQAPEGLDDLQENRVLLFQVVLELLQVFLELQSVFEHGPPGSLFILGTGRQARRHPRIRILVDSNTAYIFPGLSRICQ